jgi:TPR repeat protein
MSACTDPTAEMRPTAAQIFQIYLDGRLRFPGLSQADEANFADFVKRTADDLTRREAAIRAQNYIPPMFWSLESLGGLLGPSPCDVALAVRGSAKGGTSDARFLMGVLYHRGIVFDRDDARALRFLSSVVNDEARILIEEIRGKGDDYSQGCVLEAEGDKAMAQGKCEEKVEKAEKAAQAEAKAKFGEAKRNYEEAAERFLSGAMGKSVECITQLGKLLLRVDVDEAGKGMRLLTLAGKLGDKKAAYALGRYYLKNHDDVNGRPELRKAAELGHCLARRKLDLLAPESG